MCVLNPLNCKKPLNLLLVVKLICPNHNSPETSCTVAGFEKCYKGMLSVYVLSGLVNLTYALIGAVSPFLINSDIKLGTHTLVSWHRNKMSQFSDSTYTDVI